jgi:hypothetical protein
MFKDLHESKRKIELLHRDAMLALMQPVLLVHPKSTLPEDTSNLLIRE